MGTADRQVGARRLGVRSALGPQDPARLAKWQTRQLEVLVPLGASRFKSGDGHSVTVRTEPSS